MITPPYLQRGDRVGLVAPAGKVPPEALDHAVNVFRSWGMEVRQGAHLRSGSHVYFSGSDTERLSDLQLAFNAPDLKAVFCARGGYGTTRIIDSLDFSGILRYPKWLVGFSDITSLHLALQSLGMQSIHGAMPSQFGKPEATHSIESLYRTLHGNPKDIRWASVFNVPGTAIGQAIGGNLSLIIDSLATSSALDTTGKILILEEVDEYAYKIDRMLMHLKRSGKLKNLAGLVLGYMTGLENSVGAFGEDISKMVVDKVKEYGYPVAFRCPVGHEHPNIAWIHGGLMTLDVSGDEAVLKLAGQEGSPQPPPPGV